MKDRENRCSECLILQKEEMESPYLCEGCSEKEYVLSKDDRNDLAYTLGLLNSMILSGEQHSESSEQIYQCSLLILKNIKELK